MFVLDTNHLRELCYESALNQQLRARIASTGGSVVTTIVSAEEGTRGWLAKIAGTHEVDKQVWTYGELDKLFTVLTNLIRLPWDPEAAARFGAFRKSGIRIGAMDLKIACITLEHDAILLTRNTVDFAKVPGVRIENWLD
jgi:tRNA(fMet)-specific endonuclease VapC